MEKETITATDVGSLDGQFIPKGMNMTNMELAKSGDPITAQNGALHPDHPVRKPVTKFVEGQEVNHSDGSRAKVVKVLASGQYQVVKAHSVIVSESDLTAVE